MRGIAALALIGGHFLVTDAVQRTVIAAWVRLRPSRRERVLNAWVRFMTRSTTGIVCRVGGARMENPPALSARPGTLVVMNHQSLLDILVALSMFPDSYPGIITRRRYRKGIPLVSYMLRLYDHPMVDPGLGRRAQFVALRELAVTSPRPIVIFAEGARTKDGEIQPFQRGGLKILLTARQWPAVYVAVGDGMWRSARIGDFVRNIGSVRGRVEMLGPFSFDPEKEDADALISTMHGQMRDMLQSIRKDERSAVTS